MQYVTIRLPATLVEQIIAQSDTRLKSRNTVVTEYLSKAVGLKETAKAMLGPVPSVAVPTTFSHKRNPPLSVPHVGPPEPSPVVDWAISDDDSVI